MDEIFARVEAQWKYVAYDQRADKIWLLTAPYELDGDKRAWFDIDDGGRSAKPRNFSKRIRVDKTDDWVYICKK